MAARFEGSSIFVTGAGSGIGLAAARLFAAEGARLTLADIDRDAAEAAAAAIGGDTIAVTLDVADHEGCRAAVAAAVARWGRLDVAFNNAGIPSRITQEFEDYAYGEWRRLIDVNLGGVFNCLHAEVPAMKATGGGAIVNTASVASLVASAGASAYIAAKHGVAGLTKGAALDLIRHDIRVNAVCPGLVATPMLGSLLDTPIGQAMAAGVPLARAAQAEEIARAVLFLASDEASYCVGTLLTLDGGVTLQ